MRWICEFFQVTRCCPAMNCSICIIFFISHIDDKQDLNFLDNSSLYRSNRGNPCIGFAFRILHVWVKLRFEWTLIMMFWYFFQLSYRSARARSLLGTPRNCINEQVVLLTTPKKYKGEAKLNQCALDWPQNSNASLSYFILFIQYFYFYFYFPVNILLILTELKLIESSAWIFQLHSKKFDLTLELNASTNIWSAFKLVLGPLFWILTPVW